MLQLESTDRHLRMNQLGLSFCMGYPVLGLLFRAHIAAVLASVPGVLGAKKMDYLYRCGGSYSKQVEMYRHLSISQGSLNSHGVNVRRTANMFSSNLFIAFVRSFAYYVTRKDFHLRCRARES